jgi:hypothetical protein
MKAIRNTKVRCHTKPFWRNDYIIGYTYEGIIYKSQSWGEIIGIESHNFHLSIEHELNYKNFFVMFR